MQEPLDRGSDAFAGTCPRCGSMQLRWAIRRVRAADRPPLRALSWSCLECDAVWLEPLALGVERMTGDTDDRSADD